MTLFTHHEATVAPIIRSLADDDSLERSQIADRFARGVWTGVAEPGDRVAHAVIEGMGALQSLEFLRTRPDHATATATLAGAGVEVSAEDIAKAVDRWSPRITPADALRPFEQAVRLGLHLLVPGDDAWPTGVDDLDRHAPLALWVRGNLDCLRSVDRSIALVGARAATGYGEHVTMEASAGLVDRGYTIVSGAAYGIDGMAHRAALASSGQTVAFLAGGVDRFYPSGHEVLLSRIVERGAVVSELPCGSSPTKWRFLQRNRLIAASSLATVVLEAGWRSGSLNTAGHAVSLGRPLGAVPGPVTSAASGGCHRLLRDFDAVCVTTAEEMAELAPLGADHHEPARGLHDHQDPRVIRVIDALSERSTRTTPDVAARAGLAVAEVQAVLGSLELEGRARARETGWVKSGGR